MSNENLELRLNSTKNNSLIDSLTGLPNRDAFTKEVYQRILNSILNEKPLGLAFIDLDYFKLINDRFSHFAGDKFLSEMGNFFANYLEKSFRLGGDEFTAIIENQSDKEIKKKLLKILQEGDKLEIELSNNNIQGIINPSISIGYSSISRIKPLVNALIYEADIYFPELNKLYEATLNLTGKDKVRIPNTSIRNLNNVINNLNLIEQKPETSWESPNDILDKNTRDALFRVIENTYRGIQAPFTKEILHATQENGRKPFVSIIGSVLLNKADEEVYKVKKNKHYQRGGLAIAGNPEIYFVREGKIITINELNKTINQQVIK